MIYKVRCFQRSGFSAGNIPDVPDLLSESALAYRDYELDLRQDRFLAGIIVPDVWVNCQDYDYVLVNSWAYYCTPSMVADDACYLSLVTDYVTSAGGVRKALDAITSGYTIRYIPRTDAIAEYDEPDAFLAPAKPLVVSQSWYDTSSSTYSMVESTIDLVRTAASKDAITYVDSEKNAVVTPVVIYIGGKLLNDESTPAVGTHYSLDGTVPTYTPHSQLYDISDTTTAAGATVDASDSAKDGMTRARALGIEQAILRHVEIPSGFVTRTTRAAQAVKSKVDETKTYTEHLVTELSGNRGTYTTGLDYQYATGDYYNRIWTSEYTKYGLVSASGERCEYNPGDLYDANTAPSISWLADPRLDGKPYYRYTAVNGVTDPDGAFFFRSAVAGMQWKQIPLVYTGASGSALNIREYDNSRRVTDANYSGSSELAQMALDAFDYGNSSTLGNFFNSVSAGLSNFAASLSGQGNPATGTQDLNYAGAYASVGIGAIGAVTNPFFAADVGQKAQAIAENARAQIGALNADSAMSSIEWNREQMAQPLRAAEKVYRAARAQELSSLVVRNTVFVPTVTIPYNSETLRDFFGNGILAYRYQYRAGDIDRINRLLCMYGYKATKTLEKEDFFRHTKFDYVEAAGVSVTGYPRWLADGISAQLASGVRVWHVPPDPALYTGKSQNPVA